MKRVIGFIIAISILAYGLNIKSFAQNQGEEYVSIPVECVSNYSFSNFNISSVLKDNELYVKPQVIAELAGYNDFTVGDGKNVYIFCNEDRLERVVYILDQSELMEISYRSEFPTWKIDYFESTSGEYYVNFLEMLKYMKAGVKFTEGESTISISFPYTLDQAIIDCHRTPSVKFSWEEAGDKSENSSSILLNSTLSSILLDYNSHLVTDALFTWWNDEALNVTEEQYYDTLTEIMCYSSENYADISEDTDYALYQTQNKAFSLTNDMADLLDIDLTEIEALGKVAEFGEYSENIIDAINEYNLTRNISESMISVLYDTMANPSSDSLFAGKEAEVLVTAAKHLCDIADKGVLGKATSISDAIISAGRTLASNAVSDINPALKIIQATETIMKITPGLSDLTEMNEAIHTAANCYIIQELAFGEYSRLHSIYYESPDDINTCQQMKNALILGTKASITARDILIKSGICSKYEKSMRETNRKLSALLSKFQSCEINPAEKYSVIDWSEFFPKNSALAKMNIHENDIINVSGVINIQPYDTLVDTDFEMGNAYFIELDSPIEANVFYQDEPVSEEITRLQILPRDYPIGDEWLFRDGENVQLSGKVMFNWGSKYFTTDILISEPTLNDKKDIYTFATGKEINKSILLSSIWENDIQVNHAYIFSDDGSVTEYYTDVWYSMAENPNKILDDSGIAFPYYLEGDILHLQNTELKWLSFSDLKRSVQHYNIGYYDSLLSDDDYLFYDVEFVDDGSPSQAMYIIPSIKYQYRAPRIPYEAHLWNGHYYMVFSISYVDSFENADMFCKWLGGHLATITSQEENDAIYEFMKQDGLDNAYFGFSDIEDEGGWKWIDGTKSDFTNWHTGEPNGENSKENYAMFYEKYTDGTWNDGDFTFAQRGQPSVFICEWD